VGSLLRSFSFDAPSVTNLRAFNQPAASGGTLTVEGNSFGYLTDSTPSFSLGASSCTTTIWTATTTVMCYPSPGSGSLLNAVVSVASGLGTYQQRFTYDAPRITNVNLYNTPTSTGVQLTFAGVNYGVADPTASARVGVVSCATSVWSSNTAVLCLPTSSYGAAQTMAVTVSALVGTLSSFLTFDAPVLTTTTTNGALSAGTLITVGGLNFAVVDITISAQLSSTICATSTWTTASSITCRLAAGAGLVSSVALSLGSIAGTSLSTFTYDSPVVTLVDLPNAAQTGSL